jgi:hypothetical protein
VADEHAGALAALAKQVQKVDKSIADRDQMIVEAARTVPVPKIAKAVGLSRARIYQIIAAASA